MVAWREVEVRSSCSGWCGCSQCLLQCMLIYTDFNIEDSVKKFSRCIHKSFRFLPQPQNTSSHVYVQVQQYLGRAGLNPTGWGWKVLDVKLILKDTDLPPAPWPLLKVIRWHCKTNCMRTTCSCQKHGLLCFQACGECRGVSCTSAWHSEVAEPFDEDDM